MALMFFLGPAPTALIRLPEKRAGAEHQRPQHGDLFPATWFRLLLKGAAHFAFLLEERIADAVRQFLPDRVQQVGENAATATLIISSNPRPMMLINAPSSAPFPDLVQRLLRER